MPFTPVRTLADLDSLDEGDIVAGYRSAERGDPEPGENRGRAFWHGWRNRMIDMGELPSDDAARQLALSAVGLASEILSANDATRTRPGGGG